MIEPVVLTREEIYSVKIYWFSPFEILTGIIDKLIQLDYELYLVQEADKEKLLQILPESKRNVVFFCIKDSSDIDPWLKYIEALRQYRNISVQTGAFVRENLDQKNRDLLLMNNICVISESMFNNFPLQTIKKILEIFEAKGLRVNIRASTFGDCKAYFTFRLKNFQKEIIGEIINISVKAFLCKIELKNQLYFIKNYHFNRAQLMLGNIRIPITVKTIGYSNTHSDLYIFKILNLRIIDKKIIYDENLPEEKKIKIYKYIKYSLKTDLKRRLDAIKIVKNKVQPDRSATE